MVKVTVVLFILFLSLTGCGEDSKIQNHTVVDYELDKNTGCLLRCNNANDSSSFSSGSYQSFDCIWHCSAYKNNDQVYVDLGFTNNNDGSSCLRLQSEYISDGICISE